MISIDAFKTGLSMNDMINHFKPGSPVFNITKEGSVSNIYIKTQDSWLNVTDSSISKGGSKSWLMKSCFQLKKLPLSIK